MANNQWNALSLDEAGFNRAIENMFVNAMIRSEDRLLDIMQRCCTRTIDGDGPGKPSWRTDTSNLLRKTYPEIANGIITADVGWPDTLQSANNYLLIRALLIAYGSGDKAERGGEPIHIGPKGRIVWNSEMNGKKKSKGLAAAPGWMKEGLSSKALGDLDHWIMDLPEGFNQRGNDFINEAINEMNKHFEDILLDTWNNIPDDMISQFVKVTVR